LNKNKHFA